MKSLIFPFSLLLFFTCSLPAQADWPQWRGPDRNGIAAAQSSINTPISEEASPELLWESIEIPSDHYGGHGSVVVADNRVFLSVVWHRDEPTETRRINRDVLSKLGYRGTSSLDAATIEKMEHERMNLSRRLRGSALDEWSKKWVEENLEPKAQLALGSWIAGRFKKGSAAIPISVYETLLKAPRDPFPDQAALETWVDAQGFEPSLREQIIAAVPATFKVADDTILCLDAVTGEVVWRFSEPGSPSGRGSSSTPSVSDGRIYAALSDQFYCVDVRTGEKIWSAPLENRKGPASSPLVHEGIVYIQQGILSAFDKESGELLWSNDDVSTFNSSPVIWDGMVLCNSKNELVGVDAYAGGTLWRLPGGGDGTPVVFGDYVVITSRSNEKNLIAYEKTETKPKEIWSLDFLARRYGSSPIIYDGHVYHLGSERHLCVDLKTGEIQWERPVQSSISSPILVGDKLMIYENRGGFISIIQATPQDYLPLGRTKVGALYCATPAFSGDTLYLRTPKSVTSFRFP